MNATRLLSTVSITSVTRNIHIILSRQEQKVNSNLLTDTSTSFGLSYYIFHMLELPLQHSLFGYHCKSASVPEILFSTYSNIIESMVNPMTHQEFKKNIMEPLLETCYTANSNSATCDIPYNISNTKVVSHRGTDTMANEMAINSCMEHTSLQQRTIIDKQNYNTIRKWKRLGKGKLQIDGDDAFVFRILSFNILAQNLLEAHPYLYMQHDREALSWDIRKPLLLQEILEAQADVICLQEMQEKYLNEFLKPFKELGYKYLYKKRTNDKEDGLLLLYHSDQFNLVDYMKVEFYQPGIELLNRDNVGIVAKLSFRDSPNTQIVVATTHLLFNPRRNDIRLAQTQLLLTEIEKIAFIENTALGPKYLPIIFSGDFNLKPYTGVYKFITEGSFEYYGKGKNLEPTEFRALSYLLIPPLLHITDNCQYFHLLIKRLKENITGDAEKKDTKYADKQDTSYGVAVFKQTEFDTKKIEPQLIEITQNNYVKFSSGRLTHPFNLHSVYKHTNKHGKKEVTTNQGEWITVDYIFYSDLEPIDIYTLPTVEKCKDLPTIPNFAVGSDHLCLGASFKILKKK
ncbi:protein angel homolog 2-like isoform X1 [Vespa mandarinia]|uniref:protein angel homolog 2-like isoform X1 n=2 Tax=Vespa mandarinia TaxID=7446 RepID=UPI001613D930|nr:protein angel homolog 2-like isoform X1 [Vespa mandarinia]